VSRRGGGRRGAPGEDQHCCRYDDREERERPHPGRNERTLAGFQVPRACHCEAVPCNALLGAERRVTLRVVRPHTTLLIVSVAVACTAASGCVNTSPDRVKLSASVENAVLAVTTGSLVTTLSGTFDVELDVGDLASGDATVDAPPSFQLVVEKDQSTIRVLDATLVADAFPLTVRSGEHRTLHFSLTGANTLETGDVTRACTGPVQVAASLQDSLTADRPTAFESSGVTLSGCP